MPLDQLRSEIAELNSLDSQAVSAAYDRYYPDIYRYVSYRLGDETLAEDFASDVFIRLLEALHAGRGPRENLRGWLFGAASHLINDHLRRRYRRRQEPLEEDYPSREPAPPDEVEDRDRAGILQRALAHLTAEQQHVLTLRFGEGFSLEETATAMNKKINAVKQLQLRALAALNRQMVK